MWAERIVTAGALDLGRSREKVPGQEGWAALIQFQDLEMESPRHCLAG